MFEYFYNEILRRTIISFGTLFNNISIKHLDSDDNTVSVVKIPLAYGPTQKFLARIEQSPDLNKPFAITLPRMSFEFTGLTYDPSRKVSTTSTFTVKDPNDGKETKKSYMPVPYNMQFELAIMCKLNDDALQIVEQILPYFQPNYNLTIDLVEAIGEKRDIPITLESVSFEDNYDGDYTSRRVLLYTLKFSAKTHLFGPVPETKGDIITRVSIGVAGGDPSPDARRDLVYQKPIATKAYSGTIVTNISDNILAGTGVITVDDASNVPVRSYITLDEETLYIKEKTNNDLTVNRGMYRTTATEHVGGTPMYLITEADNDLIESGDNFGFSG